jgi:hypothetical protein
MEELQKLYDVLVREGKYSKSFEEFKSKWSQDKAYKDKVYDVVTSGGFYGKDKNSFFQKYSTLQPVVKKKDSSVSATQQTQVQNTTVSPSAGGSSGMQQYKGEDLFPTKNNVPTDMSGKPLLPKATDEALKVVAQNAKEYNEYGEKIDSDLAKQQDLYSKEYEKMGIGKIDKNTNKYLNERLKTIDSKLINNNEEYVVPKMNYQFGDLGFKFEESGATGDWMTVIAPDGKTKIEISLDPFMSSKAVSESARLQQFIKDNTPDKGLYIIEKSASEQNKKINTQKDVDLSIKKISDEANILNVELKSFLSKKDKFDKIPTTSPEYNQLQAELIAERDAIIQKQEKLKLKEVSLKKSVGKYTAMKSEQGNWLGGTWNSFLGGSSSQTAGATDFLIDIFAEIMPNEMMLSPKDLKNSSIGIANKLGIKGPSTNQTFAQWKSTLTEDQQDTIEDELDDVIKKSQKKDVIPIIRTSNREIYGTSTTTPEWEQLKSKDFWGGAYLGLARSLPAIVGGSGWAGAVQRTVQMYSQVSDGIRSEMDQNHEFDNVSENEKLAVVLPVGITGAVLEEFGLRNIKGSTGLINKIMMSALGKATTKTSAKSFRELVENEVENRLVKGLLTIGSAGLAEAETGAGQQIAEYGVKEIYNAVKDKKMFETPDTAGEWVNDVVRAGAQEAVGGFILGVPTAISAAYSKKGFLKMDDNTFKVFEAAANDENIQKAFITDLKTKITQGFITTAEAKEELNNYRNSVGLFKSLPEGLNTQQKKEAMNLLKEKRDLQNQVDGKDPSLVVKLKERINTIDESLAGISEAALSPEAQKTNLETLKENQNAVQEPTTDESVLRTEQPQLELQGVGEGNTQPQAIAEETITNAKPQEQIDIDLTLPENKDNIIAADSSNGFILIDSNTKQPVEVFNDNVGENSGISKPYATQEEAQARIEELKAEPVQEIDLGLDITENPLMDIPSTSTALGNAYYEKRKYDEYKEIREIAGVKDTGTFTEISKAYHEAKIDGSNPKLVEAVENLLIPKVEIKPAEEIVLDIDAAERRIAEEESNEIDSLLDLDTSDKTNLQKVSDFLNKIDDSLSEGLKPNKLNDITTVMSLATAKAVVKALKALVNAGITLQEAIKRVSETYKTTPENINKALNIVYQDTQNQTQGLSEADLPGYDNMMTKAEAIVKEKKRGRKEAEMYDAVMGYVTGSKAYETATDVQREALVRDVRKRFGLKEKAAPSVGKLFGKIKDIAKITITEKAGLIKQIKDTAKGARESVKAFKLASQQLTKDIKELASKGTINAKQVASILRAFSKVNVLNDASVSNFVDYMTKVFNDADYSDKIDTAKSNLKTAKKNIVTKLGIADGLILPLQRLFAINPTMIPDAYLGKYLSLVDMFGKKQAVLTLEEKSQTIKDVQEILDEINNERSLVDELADRFNNSDNKVFKDEKLDYSATLDKMLEEGEIDNNEKQLMSKYKKDIVPQVERSQQTEEEIQAEKDELIKITQESKIDGTELSTKNERDLSKKLNSLIKGKAINELTNTELKNLLKVIDNINNGYLPHYTQLMVEKLNSINNSNTLEDAVNKSKPLPLSKLYAKAKSLLTKKDAMLEMIRRNPLFNIDQVLGDFKTKDIFNSLFNKAAEAEAKFTSELKNVQSLLEKAEERVAKSFKLDANKTLISKFKMMTYMVQLEYNSNPDNKQVNPAAEYLKATIKHIQDGKSQFGERDAEMLQEIYDKYIDSEGNIDNEKLYNSFNNAEKGAIKTVRDINESLKDKAEYTGAIIRGQKINPLNNYVHLNVLHEYKPNDLASGESFANDYNNSMRPSTKAKSLIERTGKVSPLNFDIFASAQRGAKFVLMDYHLTEPIRTARKTMNRTISNMEGKGKVPKEKRQIINAINNAFEETIENLVVNNYTETSFGDDVADYISKQGYRAVLAGTGRFVSEFLSNVGFVLLSDPTAFTEGIKNIGLIMSADAPIIMNNVNSKETNRIFPTDTLSGRMIDSNILSQASGIKGGKSKNIVANKIQQIFNLSGKKYVNAVELLSDILISTPDKAIMRPIWFGSFAYNFKKITGKDIDFEKIVANDEVYMDENKDAIEESKTIADERSVITGSSSNAFTGILKGTSKVNQSITTKAFNNFNSFMTKFMVYEYVTARTGIMAAIGNGSLTKKQGIALLAATTTRMTVYSLLIKVLGGGIIGLLFDDEDDEKEKAPEKAVGQALASTFSSMLLGRDFGNVTKTAINYGVEQVNENYLDFLREGDYDPYKDALQYSVVPAEKKGTQTGVYDFFKNMTGSYGPAIKTADLVLKKAFEDDKKQRDAKERQEKEKNIRIPLEVLGNLGLVPLYKEVRKSLMKDIYKDLENKKEKKGMSKEDIKKKDPQMYKIMYGND